MKFKTSKEKCDILRNLVLETLYPEIFDLFTIINKEPYYFHIIITGFNEMAIDKDRVLHKKSANGGWERADVQNTITNNFCPFLDRWNKDATILSLYVEAILKGIYNLKKERQDEEAFLDTQIKNIMQLPSISTRIILIEKTKHE